MRKPLATKMFGEIRRPVRVGYLSTERGTRPRVARILYACSVPVIVGWVILVGVLNVFVPQLETVVEQKAQSFLPDSASSVQALEKMGEHFGGGGSNNFVYLLVEGDQPLDDQAHTYYTTLLRRLTADTTHVGSVMDLWSNPDLAPAAQSADGKVAYALVNLTGNMGTALAMESTRTARDVVAGVPAPQGIDAHVTGPSAVVNDELVAISESMIRLIVLCSLLVSVVLVFVYRSLATVLLPLLTVASSLAGARAAIALFGRLELVHVSIFAAALSAVVVLGAGTNYGIFLLGRYQEGRRHGLGPEDAYYAALAGVQHIIIASALTVAGAMACLTLTRLSIFSTSGLPCTIAIVVTLAAALTLGPAILAVMSRLGLAEPRVEASPRRWRRVATCVVRWPGPVLAGSMAVLLAAMALVPTFRPSYNERIAQPADSPANSGFAAADRHLPANTMAPSVFLLESDHDMRNPADLIALDKLAGAIAGLPDVAAVQGITRPLAAPIAQGTLTSQAGYIGDRVAQMTSLIQARLRDIDDVGAALDTLDASTDGVSAALARGRSGLAELAASTDDLRTGTAVVTTKIAAIKQTSEPAAEFLRQLPQCATTDVCRSALTGLSLLDDAQTFDGLAAQLHTGTTSVTGALPDAAAQIPAIKSAITQARSTIAPVRSMLAALVPQAAEITSFLDEVSRSYAGGAPGSAFFLPSQALQNPLFRTGMPYFFSVDGKVTRMVVTPSVEGFSREAMDLSAQIIPTALGAIKGTSLQGSTVSIGGPGGTLLNIESFAHEDFVAIVIAALAFVFCVVLVLLRSLVAAGVVITTVAVSYLSALGLAVFLWQDVVGKPLHWSVAPVAFTFLVAVGADYNMLLVSRIREEISAGYATGLIRAMVGTGSVVTTAGLTFGVTMFAMLGSSASNIAQIGTTVGIGLVIDTLIVRSLVVPSVARLAGRWFWWPTTFVQWPQQRATHG